MALYGAPVWSNRLKIRRFRSKVYRLQRKMAIRIVRGYRTISFEAATLLARFPPLDILAEMDSVVYNQIRVLRQTGEGSADRNFEVTIRRQERKKALAMWQARLREEPYVHKRVVEAILPVFETWMERTHGSLTYRLTQIITGHGCFSDYLNKIKREPTANCYHCGEQDSATHTLSECAMWEEERRNLTHVIGENLALPAVVIAMLTDVDHWKAVASFCETVMIKKETAERHRERAIPARRRRRRGEGMNRLGLSA